MTISFSCNNIHPHSLAHLTSLQLIGFKTELPYFPDYEVHSRLPLSIFSRILLGAYAASLN